MAEDGICVVGIGFDSEWSVDLIVGGWLLCLMVSGMVNLKDGEVYLLFRFFDLISGEICFDGDIENVCVQLVVKYECVDLIVEVQVVGLVDVL